MRRLFPLLVWAFMPFSCAGALAQSNDGYVGIYGDSLGTQACASVPPYTSTTLYVIAKTAGQSADGITGVEFRIEVTNPSGWFLSYTPPGTASITMGNPIDTDPDPGAGGGLNLGFPSCQVPDSNGQVKLGTISAFNASGSPTNLLVKRHSQPSNGVFPCALFVKCDSLYAKTCMTPTPPDSCTLGTQKAVVVTTEDPTLFTATLNSATGQGPDTEVSYPEREVTAYVRDGVIVLPPGQPGAVLESTTINSPAVAAVLENHEVEWIAKRYPTFDRADTVTVIAPGDTVKLTDWSLFFVMRLSVSGDPTQLVQDLSAIPHDVVFAEQIYGGVEENVTVGGMLKAGIGDTPSANCVYEPPSATCTLTIPDCPDDLQISQWGFVNAGQTVGAIQGSCDIDVNAEEAWRTTKGTPSTTIAILSANTGITRHEDLNPVIGMPPAVCTPPGGCENVNVGTPEAGVVAAATNNFRGVAGMNWFATIFSWPVDPRGAAIPCSPENPFCLDQNAALYAAWQNNARVVNIDWHAQTPTGLPRPNIWETWRKGLGDSYRANMIVVVAMGDGGTSTPYWPAAIPQGIIAVGAVNNVGERWVDSNMGDHIDVVAPGVDVLTTSSASTAYTMASGTGIAAAHVAGLAGLLVSYRPDLANDDVEQIIRLSARHPSNGPEDPIFGTGLIDAGRALEFLQSPYRLYHGIAYDPCPECAGNSEVVGKMTIAVPIPALASDGRVGGISGTVYAERHVSWAWAQFPVTFKNPPYVWGRGAFSNGLSKEVPNIAEPGTNHWGYTWCEPDPTSIQRSGCLLRTYKYQLYRCADGVNCQQPGAYIGMIPWYTPDPTLKLAYTVLGELDVTDTTQEEVPSRSSLLLTGPNPFLVRGTLEAWLPIAVSARLAIVDVQGHEVAVLHSGALEAGHHGFPWNGLAADGRRVAAGIYFARLVTARATATWKMLVLR